MKKIDWDAPHIFWLTLAALMIMLYLIACSGPKRTQGQKDYDARIERQQTLEAVRKQFPCDTGALIHGKVILTPQYVYVDNPTTGRQDKYECPPSGIRVDTLPVYDMALMQIVRDSVDNLKFLLDGAIQAHTDEANKNEALQAQIGDLKPFKTKYIASLIIGGLIGLFFIARTFKLI